MKAKLLDKDFRYHSAQESIKPGYLARRFAAIRKEQQKNEQEAKTVVVQMKGKLR